MTVAGWSLVNDISEQTSAMATLVGGKERKSKSLSSIEFQAGQATR